MALGIAGLAQRSTLMAADVGALHHQDLTELGSVARLDFDEEHAGRRAADDATPGFAQLVAYSSVDRCRAGSR